MNIASADSTRASLSSVAATRRQAHAAIAAVVASAVIFFALLPFAKVQLAQVWPFIPIYESALIISDAITAVLLFGQFGFLRSRAMLVLACGYLFTALAATAHMLTFPGLFSQAGLLGAGPQSTAWLYMFWHGGFPLVVVAYAWLKTRTSETPRDRAWIEVSLGIAIAAAAACAFTLLVTAGAHLLPPIMSGNQYTPAMIAVVGSTWLFSAVALAVLWRQAPHTVIDLWLMVVMCAWIFDIGLSAVFNHGRFDVGFYSGRIYGLLAASFVLWLLLIENALLYGQLARKTVELVELNKELDSFSYSVSHDLRAPLRAVDGFALMLDEDYAGKLDDEGRRLIGVVRSSAQRMSHLIDDLLEFSRLGRKEIARERVDMAQVAHEVAGEIAPGSRAIEIAQLPAASGDRSLLRQVWVNLIGNAIKYSSKAQDPRVEVGARPDGAMTLYWVRDNGAGFDMKYAAKLFGVFQRLHRQDQFEGTGIGLANVRRIVQRHGGRTWAEAEVDKGASFYFSLPGAGAERAEEAA
jgi:signal transduction histidine kinase